MPTFYSHNSLPIVTRFPIIFGTDKFLGKKFERYSLSLRYPHTRVYCVVRGKYIFIIVFEFPETD